MRTTSCVASKFRSPDQPWYTYCVSRVPVTIVSISNVAFASFGYQHPAAIRSHQGVPYALRRSRRNSVSRLAVRVMGLVTTIVWVCAPLSDHPDEGPHVKRSPARPDCGVAMPIVQA